MVLKVPVTVDSKRGDPNSYIHQQLQGLGENVQDELTPLDEHSDWLPARSRAGTQDGPEWDVELATGVNLDATGRVLGSVPSGLSPGYGRSRRRPQPTMSGDLLSASDTEGRSGTEGYGSAAENSVRLRKQQRELEKQLQAQQKRVRIAAGPPSVLENTGISGQSGQGLGTTVVRAPEKARKRKRKKRRGAGGASAITHAALSGTDSATDHEFRTGVKMTGVRLLGGGGILRAGVSAAARREQQRQRERQNKEDAAAVPQIMVQRPAVVSQQASDVSSVDLKSQLAAKQQVQVLLPSAPDPNGPGSSELLQKLSRSRNNTWATCGDRTGSCWLGCL